MKKDNGLEELENQDNELTEESAEMTEDEQQESLDKQLEVDEGEAGDEISQLRLELDEYKNLYLRKAAEFENFKKRKQVEFTTLIQNAEESLIASILPVLDDFDRFEENSEGDSEALMQGIKMIREKLWNELSSRGVEIIESVGKPFDPLLHEAIMQQEVEGQESDIVFQEHQRGYRLGEKIIRHSKVIVTA